MTRKKTRAEELREMFEAALANEKRPTDRVSIHIKVLKEVAFWRALQRACQDRLADEPASVLASGYFAAVEAQLRQSEEELSGLVPLLADIRGSLGL